MTGIRRVMHREVEGEKFKWAEIRALNQGMGYAIEWYLKGAHGFGERCGWQLPPLEELEFVILQGDVEGMMMYQATHRRKVDEAGGSVEMTLGCIVEEDQGAGPAYWRVGYANINDGLYLGVDVEIQLYPSPYPSQMVMVPEPKMVLRGCQELPRGNSYSLMELAGRLAQLEPGTNLNEVWQMAKECLANREVRWG
jgi:hypothetical protein